MKRKVITFICIFLILTAAIFVFVSCDKNNEKVDDDTVYISINTFLTVIDVGESSKGLTRSMLTERVPIKKGEKFSWNYYTEYRRSIGQPIGGFSGSRMLGFYTDSLCRYKYDEETDVLTDVSLYIDTRSGYGSSSYDANYCLVNFIYERNTYSVFRGFNEYINMIDFTVSAYGKSIDENALEFYWDEDYTVPFDMENSGQIITLKDHWDSCPGELTVYVKKSR